MTKLQEVSLLAAAITATVALAAMAASESAFAQEAAGPQPGDPQRWYQPNVTDADRYRTAMKEAGAAQKEALDECRTKAGGEREPCAREARERYRSDVEAAKSFAPRNTIEKAPK
jgi:hypothetical protein